MTRRGLMIGVVLVILTLAVLFIAPQFSPDVKETDFYRLAGADQQIIYLLGTMHGEHLKSERYSLWHLQAVIVHLQPDLLLVESRPEEIAKDNWGDGPVEMTFAALTARTLGIPVQGMDWWVKASLYGDSSEREDRMVQNILKCVPGYRTVLILTGRSHVDGFKQRLAQAGFVVVPFSSAEKQPLFELVESEPRFPAGMTRYIRRRLEIDRALFELETDPNWKSRLESNIAFEQELLRLIARVGEKSQ
jgi:hypothetical protein